MPIQTIVAGASGRMGQVVIRQLAGEPDFTLIGALESGTSSSLGADSGERAGIGMNGIGVSNDPLPLVAKADAIIDFSTPEASVALAALAAQARIVHIIGTTGFSGSDEERIRAAARHATIVKSGNMSLGVTLLAALVKEAAKALPDFDVEIVEMHHRMKKDAPSGTALLLGAAAAEGRNTSPANAAARHDSKSGPRKEGTIGFASLRGGTVVGDHSVILAGASERLVLSHIAEDRAIFARGAIAAARWGQGKKPGLYAMADVLGLLR